MITTPRAVIGAVAFISGVAAGTVTLFDNPGFQGESYTVEVSPWFCYSFSQSFNDRASSATWNLPRGHQAKIQFFEHINCVGTMREWPMDEFNFPNNFAMDGIDNMVTSVRMIGDWCWECESTNVNASSVEGASTV